MSSKKKLLCCLSLFVVFTCNKEQEITFIEINNSFVETASVDVNIQKAEGSHSISAGINTTIENHIANMLLFSEEPVDHISIKEAAQKFNEEAVRFKNDFEESNVVFEAQFDSELSYQSSDIISIAITGYLNTGGAHGNTNITIFNFDAQTGNVLDFDTLITDEESFTDLAQSYFEKEVHADENKEFSDYFFGEEYHLPANIGYSDKGIVLVYNQYEVASYATGITQYTIPYSELTDILIKH